MNLFLWCLFLVEVITCTSGIWNSRKKGEEYTYVGFDYCDQGGWHCFQENGTLHVNFRCTDFHHDYNNEHGYMPTNFQSVRLWVWTARLPLGTTIFTVSYCKAVQLHLDCSSSERNSNVKEFNVQNVEHLVILPPSARGEYLHDNIKSALLPEKFSIQNVGKVDLIPEMFLAPARNCENIVATPTDFSIDNSTVEKFETELIDAYTFTKFSLNNVTVITNSSSRVSLLATNIIITNSTFSDLYIDAFQLIAQKNITLKNNTFGRVEKNGFTLRSQVVEFRDNKVQELLTASMNILAFSIVISGNLISHVDIRAFENVRFAYVMPTYETASRFQYNFTKNTIWSLEPGSLHPNWLTMKDTCAEITFEGNKFDCTCPNFGWLGMLNAMGSKLLQFLNFYENYIIQGSNVCIQNTTCSIPTIVDHLTDLCKNKTDIRKICSQQPVIEPEDSYDQAQQKQLQSQEKQTQQEQKQLQSQEKQTQQEQKQLQSQEKQTQQEQKQQEIQVPPQQQQQQQPQPQTTESSYTQMVSQRANLFATIRLGNYDNYDQERKLAQAQHHTAKQPFNTDENNEKKDYNARYIVPSIIAVVLIASVAFTLCWLKRSNRQRNITTVYKNHTDSDDNPIVINEHSNQLYHEEN